MRFGMAAALPSGTRALTLILLLGATYNPAPDEESIASRDGFLP